MFWAVWWISVALLIVACVLLAMSWPKKRRHRSSSPPATGALRIFPNDPVKAVYMGYAAGISSIDTAVQAALDAGYNHIILAFYLGPGTGVDPFSAAYYWELLSDATKIQVANYAHSKNAKISISAGGATYVAYPLGGGTAFGQGAAQFALDNHLDGVDFDLENFTNTFGTPSGLTKAQSIAWMNDATNAARSLLGAAGVITHAPQPPYFNVEFNYGYLDFMLQSPVPSVDYLLIQYYNNGATFLTYDSQFINDDDFHPGTAIAQLITSGIPGTHMVIGRLTQARDGASNSWIDPATLGQWFETGAADSRTDNWKTGFSTWEFHENGDGSPSSQAFLEAVYPSE